MPSSWQQCCVEDFNATLANQLDRRVDLVVLLRTPQTIQIALNEALYAHADSSNAVVNQHPELGRVDCSGRDFD